MVAIKLTVPKRIGGVKLPKPLRRSLKKLSETKNGRTKIAEALVAAGGVLAIVASRGGKAGTPKTPKASTKPLVKSAALAPKSKGRSTPKPLSQPL